MSVWQNICEQLGLVLCEVWSGLPSVVRGGVRVVSRNESDKKRVVVKKPELESRVWVCVMDVLSPSPTGRVFIPFRCPTYYPITSVRVTLCPA